MKRASAMYRAGHARKRGFTLLEILIVGALIALFAGLAIFGAQEFYDSNRRKAMFDEARQLGTAMSFAYDDVGFFPKISILTQPLALVQRNVSGQTIAIRPGFDTYGQLGEISPYTAKVTQSWRGPYLGSSEARARISQGSKGLVKMRLPDISQSATTQWGQLTGTNISVVDWPTDTWGNPYMLYVVVAEPTGNSTNPLGLRLITRPGESGSFLTAIVSYGPNGVPGGAGRDTLTDDSIDAAARQAARAYIETELKPARLYIINNVDAGTEPETLNDPDAGFTLKVFAPANGSTGAFTSNFFQKLPNSITNRSDPDNILTPGILDKGSDDIMWRF